jgi:sulfite reductase (NADPH) hemoprotein beta-component
MYKYDEYDHSIVASRVEEFRDQVNRRLAGQITEDQFKPLRLMNGLYLQLHAYMLRVAVPYGTLDSRQMRMLAHIARKYDRDYGHFTTRQNIQYNWIKLEDAPDILAELATVEMHAIQTSGNCIRNISSDQYAGAAADELTDPRPWAELLRQWSTFHPEFSYLPRKFKIAVIAADEDRAAMRLHDIGLQIVEKDGVHGVAVYVGGGMGRTPMIAPLIKDFVPFDDFVSYMEACLRVYNRYGRRDNMYKARIKILVHEIGAEKYREEVEAEFAAVKQLGIDPPRAEFDRIAAHFADPAFETGLPDDLDRSDPDFAVWLDQNVAAHKAPGYAIVNISLKPTGGIPGDASSAQIDLMADLAEKHSFDELRVTHAQNIVLPHVRKADLYAIWQQLREAGLAEANLDLITDIIACPGLDYCSLANARSIPWPRRSPRANSPISAVSANWVNSSSRSAAASTPAATTMPAISASSASTVRASRTISSRSAARARRMCRSARSPAPASARTASSTRSRRRPTSISPGAKLANASSIPIAVSAWPRSRRPFMADQTLRFRDDEVHDEPAVTLDSFLGQSNATAVRIESGEDARALLPHLDRLSLVEVSFPKFRDGRGYSSARILREAGYTGELRAQGDVLVDQIPLMRRCGFDSFAPEAEVDEAVLAASLARYDHVYQAAADPAVPVWKRRHG